MKVNKRLLLPIEDYSWSENTGESIILHTTLGTNYEGAEDTLKARHLSYHYIIDTDGKIYQLVDVKRAAWHAGVKSGMNLRAKAFYGGTNPNKHSVGIAFVGMSEYITTQQRDAAVWLIKEIGKQTGHRYNANNIFYHQEITDYKPKFVGKIRERVIEQLVGFKDEKDVVVEPNRLQLLLRIAQLKLILAQLKIASMAK